MQAINTLAIPVLSYGFGIIDWMQEDLNKLDVMTRKMLHAHKMTYKNQCVPRIHVSRKKGGMGVPTIDIIYKSEIIGIGKYLKGNDGRFIGWVHEHENLKPSTTSIIKKMNDYLRDVRFDGEGRNNESLEREIKNAKMTYKEKREEANLEQWKNHTFAKHHKNILDEAFIDTYKSNEVMIKGWLKSEDERTILAAQDQALRTNWFKKHIEGQNITDKCRMCSGGSESVCHILSECKFLLQKGTYTERHNNICRLIHYRICRKFEIEVNTVNHWEHNPNNIEENNRVLILYDYNIPTDAQVTHNLSLI